jgi:uncharacterized protein YbjT (DUF2867 family)
MKMLVTGATGFVGGRLAGALSDAGHEIRALVRDAGSDRARELADAGYELHEGDVLDADSLVGAGRGVDVAYYLVHSMGRGASGADFERRERGAAHAFARMAQNEGVGRVVYLGGLGDEPKSKHLRSRHETAEILAADGPPLTYFRASMVIGPGSESYLTLRSLVSRLPVMIAPSWLKTETQPIHVDDVIAYLCAAPSVPAREIQIGSPDVVTYGGLLDLMADALGKRRPPKLPVPLLSPWLSSQWIGLVTPVDADVARPLIEGLSTPTTVTDPSGMELFDDIEPIGVHDALELTVDQAATALK